MSELLKLNLASIKGYLLGDDFQRFWDYQRPDFADRFFGNGGPGHYKPPCVRLLRGFRSLACLVG